MNATVSAIGKMHLEGNIIPMGWFSQLCFEDGKPNTVAIICLSEIIYWYRPAIVRDEETGKVIEYRQKFKADKWQCHYSAMAERFGFTKVQVRNALHFLEAKGCITLEFRHVVSAKGIPLANVLFVEPVPDAIAKITYLDVEGGVSHICDTIPTQELHHPNMKVGTYTETPKETPREVGGDREVEVPATLNAPVEEVEEEPPPRFGLFGGRGRENTEGRDGQKRPCSARR